MPAFIYSRLTDCTVYNVDTCNIFRYISVIKLYKIIFPYNKITMEHVRTFKLTDIVYSHVNCLMDSCTYIGMKYFWPSY